MRATIFAAHGEHPRQSWQVEDLCTLCLPESVLRRALRQRQLLHFVAVEAEEGVTVVFEVVLGPGLEAEPAPVVVVALGAEVPDASDEPAQCSCAARHGRRWLAPARGPFWL